MFNYHCHINYSIDVQGSAEDYCKEALKQGIKYLCFTTHFNMKELEQGNLDFTLTNEKLKNYIEEINKAKKKFPKLDIRIGLEVGLHHEFLFEGYLNAL